MFAVVRTGGKQYRVTAGDKIVVEKLAGQAGDKIDITDILLAGEGSELKSVAGLIVGAEIVAQAKGDKVTVFKKRRRHNYRRKAGHRQNHTILKIVSIGGEKAKAAKPKAEAAPAEKPAAAPAKAEAAPAAEAPAKKAETKAKTDKAPSTKDAAPAKAAAKKALRPSNQPFNLFG
ncbi:50S ribosomal protein L21 [Sphingomonas daechungensis]|uniref:Large ribosomal subunit protein bL21 n=1 Tax=Sphingomonas daechungensis TaxID=1176646 RepID=A0ABX6T6I1_9SPHN|nr:50S ribosomal protein L21 [Sphingomonas daechungensis]QNP43248.1 50S ribosomal protein L21 [Sphingomonas daechungensis]